MIKVTMLVKRHEDRYETEFTFDSSESKPQAAGALAEFFRKKSMSSQDWQAGIGSKLWSGAERCDCLYGEDGF